MIAEHRILIVDDEPSIRRMLKAVLARGAYVTEEARNGHEALERLENGAFDAIVSDVNMPGLTGLEFLRAVRERDLDVPIILMTGAPNIEAASQAVEYGAFRFLVKPVAPNTVCEVVNRAVQLHELARVKRDALELNGFDARWHADRAALESAFVRALDGLWMARQPIVSWRARSVFGYEALLRSTEPTFPNPGVMLEAAERLGRLRELGRAIRVAAARAPPPHGAKLFVNVNGLDLEDDDLYSPTAPLSRVAERVVLEVTERESLEGVSDLEKRIGVLRSLGFMVAVDDLGAGYAGLTSFTQLSPDIAKLDMSLVRGIDTDPRKQSIVRSMRALCADLAILVVCEGVETPAERDTLLELGCELFQGYLFAKPGRDFPQPDWG